MIEDNHIVTEIDDRLYDIRGEYHLDEWKEAVIMWKKGHFIADSWRDWQRVERMLKKYEEYTI